MLGTGHDEVCLCPTADPLATQTPCTRFGSSSACANRPPAPLDVDDGLTCMAFARLLRTCSKSSTSADMLREYQISLARFLALCTFLQTVGVTLGTRSSLRLAAQRRRRIHVAATSATETCSCASFPRGHPLALRWTSQRRAPSGFRSHGGGGLHEADRHRRLLLCGWLVPTNERAPRDFPPGQTLGTVREQRQLLPASLLL